VKLISLYLHPSRLNNLFIMQGLVVSIWYKRQTVISNKCYIYISIWIWNINFKINRPTVIIPMLYWILISCTSKLRTVHSHPLLSLALYDAYILPFFCNIETIKLHLKSYSNILKINFNYCTIIF